MKFLVAHSQPLVFFLWGWVTVSGSTEMLTFHFGVLSRNDPHFSIYGLRTGSVGPHLGAERAGNARSISIWLEPSQDLHRKDKKLPMSLSQIESDVIQPSWTPISSSNSSSF